MAAVTFDSHFQDGAASVSNTFSFVSNAPVSGVSGSVANTTSRVLIASVAFRNNVLPTGVSVHWDSTDTNQNMTSAGSKLTITGASLSIDLYLFGLIAPTVGAKTLRADWTGGSMTGVCLGAWACSAADQGTGWSDLTPANATGDAASVTVPSASGDLVVAAEGDDDATSGTIATGTSDWEERNLNGNYLGARAAAAGASTIVAWTLAGGKAWGMLGLRVRQILAEPQMHYVQMKT